MPNLVAIDVSVVDNRLLLTFSDHAVAHAYRAYRRAQDWRSPQHGQQSVVAREHRGSPKIHSSTREVSLSLPGFITWFITCRLPDDEDSVIFTFMPEHGELAARWAASMALFEEVPASGHDGDGDTVVKQLHVRRLWNKAKLLKRLEELTMGAATGPVTSMTTTPTSHRSRVGSPAWGNGGGRVPVAVGYSVSGGMQRGDIWW